MVKVVAFIPARAGSKRVPGKNILPLAGHPLIAYSITAAIQSQVFDSVIVSTDSKQYAEIAQYYGADVPFLRPNTISGDVSPDIDWLKFSLKYLLEHERDFDVFCILRPTSPFRLPETIQRAWNIFLRQEGVDSLRAVEKCKQHPGKMWVVNNNRMTPLLPFHINHQPWHSNQYQALPEVYIQNASIEIAWTHVVERTNTISGYVIMPFFTEGLEGFDVNRLSDWKEAEILIASGEAVLPRINKPPKH